MISSLHADAFVESPGAASRLTVRKAVMHDIAPILHLINSYAARGIMLAIAWRTPWAGPSNSTMFLTTPNPSLGRANSCKVLQGPVSVETGCGESPSLGVAARGSAALLPISCSFWSFLDIITIPNRLSVVRSRRPDGDGTKLDCTE